MAGAVIGALRVNLSIDSAEFKRGLTTAEQTLQKFDRAVTSAVKTGLTVFAAGAVAGAAALTALTKSSIDTISAQVDLANRVGASVSAIQTLQHAAELSGASQEALAKTLGTLNARLGEAAREGAGPAYEALQRLGLSAKALSEMDADERIAALSDRMKDLGYNTQQQADTLRNLGVRQQEIINLFQEGSSAIDEARQSLSDFGVLVSDVDARKIEEVGDALDRLKMAATGVGNQVAVELAPRILDVTERIEGMAKSGQIAAYIANDIKTAFEFLERTIDVNTGRWEAITRAIQQFKDVWASFRFGEDGGPDWEAYARANEKYAADTKRIWGGVYDDLYAHSPAKALVDSLDAHLNSLNPLVQSVDARIKKMFETKGDEGGPDDATKKRLAKEAEERAQYQDHLSQKLVSLQESLMSEREAAQYDYEQRLMDLEDFHNRGMISDQEYTNYLIANKKGYAATIADIDEDLARKNERAAARQRDAYFQIASDIGSALTSIFGENKAVAMGMAVVNTAQAVTRTLAEYGATPWGLAAAAVAAAAGAAEIATIASASKSGGGGGRKGGGVAASAPSVPAAGGQGGVQSGNSQTLFLRGINPGQIFTGEALRELMAQIVDAQRDGATIVLAPV